MQPFGVLGHNGEINTIARLRQEARMLGVPIPRDGSDSQDLSRTVEALIHRDGLTLVEALELVLPPIVNEIKGMPEELRGFYMYLRQAFGPFAQGPVALSCRATATSACSPSTRSACARSGRWRPPTRSSSPPSPAWSPVADTAAEPKPLAPGEKLLVTDRPRRRAAARCSTTASCSGSAAAAGASAPGARPATRFAQAHPDRRPARGRRDPRLHERRARPSRSRSRTACWAASAGSATT